jgi:hypothetical protein
MANRKKKTENQIIEEVSKLIAEETLQDTDSPKKKTRKSKEIISADIAEVSTTERWPKIDQGSHLTVKTFENGRTELIWDDEALTRDVKNAILSYESKIPVSKVKKVLND